MIVERPYAAFCVGCDYAGEIPSEDDITSAGTYTADLDEGVVMFNSRLLQSTMIVPPADTTCDYEVVLDKIRECPGAGVCALKAAGYKAVQVTPAEQRAILLEHFQASPGARIVGL